MKFKSTRGKAAAVSFKEAIFQGLAPDGGLYLPIGTPCLKGLFSGLNGNGPFFNTASKVISALLLPEVSPEEAEKICKRAFPFEPVLNPLEEDVTILELFHGPSCAFKDFGASFLASAMEFFLETENRRSIILTATSGDTGSAVAQAFYKKSNIDVVILYPKGRVSPLQEKQLTTLGENVTALEVAGSFDDCQRMVKEVFTDPEISALLPLTSANSINLGRLIPQSLYYIWAAARFPAGTRLVFSVPSGNFGNLTAGVLAHLWGMPAEGFIAATNKNDVVPEYLEKGIFTPRASVHTYSNAMDVGDPSNFERLSRLLPSKEEMRALISPQVVTDKETLETIRGVYDRFGRILDPHTAVGYLGAKREKYYSGKDIHKICLATAHPGKFTEVVEQATGKTMSLPERLLGLLAKEKRSIPSGNTKEDLARFLKDRFA